MLYNSDSLDKSEPDKGVLCTCIYMMKGSLQQAKDNVELSFSANCVNPVISAIKDWKRHGSMTKRLCLQDQFLYSTLPPLFKWRLHKKLLWFVHQSKFRSTCKNVYETSDYTAAPCTYNIWIYNSNIVCKYII